MSNFFSSDSPSLSLQRIAGDFRLFGWLGFGLQILLGFIPILVVVSKVLFYPNRQQTGGFGLFLAIACLIVLIFSIYWCFRYTQLGQKLEIPDLRPAKGKIIWDLKLGLIINLVSMVVEVLITLVRVGELSFLMLSVPQNATIITPGQIGTFVTQGKAITPSHMITIQAMVSSIAAGLVGVIVSLWLLHRVGQHSNSRERRQEAI